MCINPSIVALNLGCILRNKILGNIKNILLSMLYSKSIKSNFWGRNLRGLYVHVCVHIISLSFNSALKFTRPFHCAARMETCSGWFRSSTSLHTFHITYLPAFIFFPTQCTTLSQDCIFSPQLFLFLLICLEGLMKIKIDLCYLKGNFNL